MTITEALGGRQVKSVVTFIAGGGEYAKIAAGLSLLLDDETRVEVFAHTIHDTMPVLRMVRHVPYKKEDLTP